MKTLHTIKWLLFLAVLLALLSNSSASLAASASHLAAPRVSQQTSASGLARSPLRPDELAAPAKSGGKLLWKYLTGNLVYSSPAVASSVVYVGSDDG